MAPAAPESDKSRPSHRSEIVQRAMAIRSRKRPIHPKVAASWDIVESDSPKSHHQAILTKPGLPVTAKSPKKPCEAVRRNNFNKQHPGMRSLFDTQEVKSVSATQSVKEQLEEIRVKSRNDYLQHQTGKQAAERTEYQGAGTRWGKFGAAELWSNILRFVPWSKLYSTFIYINSGFRHEVQLLLQGDPPLEEFVAFYSAAGNSYLKAYSDAERHDLRPFERVARPTIFSSLIFSAQGNVDPKFSPAGQALMANLTYGDIKPKLWSPTAAANTFASVWNMAICYPRATEADLVLTDGLGRSVTHHIDRRNPILMHHLVEVVHSTKNKTFQKARVVVKGWYLSPSEQMAVTETGKRKYWERFYKYPEDKRFIAYNRAADAEFRAEGW